MDKERLTNLKQTLKRNKEFTTLDVIEQLEQQIEKMTTKQEYEEKKKYFDSEIKKLSNYLKVEITENKDATGEVMMCFWLYKKKNGRAITCVFDLLDLETIRIVLENYDKVD